MRRPIATSLLLLLLAALLPAPAAAEETRPQKLFKQRLLADRGVSPAVKAVLRRDGFVRRGIRFGDVTGDGVSDALVVVDQGGSAGGIALYIYSSHGRQTGGGDGDRLRIVYKNQRLYRVRAGMRAASSSRPRGAIVYRTPVYDPGDELSDPGAYRDVELRWSRKRARFAVSDAAIVDRVRTRFCARSGDYCIETIKTRAGVVYLELRSLSFNGRYFLCVRDPDGRTQCGGFTLRRSGDRFVSRVRWSANFPNKGRGRYDVVWRLGAQKLGPTLGFRRG